MKKILILGAWLLLSLTSPAHAEKIVIAAASDLKFAMDEIVAEFKAVHSGDAIDVIYGSSGKFFTQIQQGAPYDLFFSADIELPRELAKNDLAASEIKSYAFGRIVLWSERMDASKMTLASLKNANIAHIAIANPKHAPYGKRAEEALRASGIWQDIEPRLVLGENIAQTAQFVQSGNAEIGIIALSLAMSPELAKKGGYYLIPDNLHEPLEQGFIITAHARNNALAKHFAEFFNSAAARAIMIRYGFILPNETTIK